MASAVARIQSAQGPAACVAPHPEARLDPALAALRPRVPNEASARAGGAVGAAIDDALKGPFTIFGAWALLVAGLVIGLIVTVHFSPGALLVTAVGAVRAANAERARLRDLVAAPSAEKARPGKPAPATSDLLTRSATILATAPATKAQPGLWEIDEQAEVDVKRS